MSRTLNKTISVYKSHYRGQEKYWSNLTKEQLNHITMKLLSAMTKQDKLDDAAYTVLCEFILSTLYRGNSFDKVFFMKIKKICKHAGNPIRLVMDEKLIEDRNLRGQDEMRSVAALSITSSGDISLYKSIQEECTRVCQNTPSLNPMKDLPVTGDMMNDMTEFKKQVVESIDNYKKRIHALEKIVLTISKLNSEYSDRIVKLEEVFKMSSNFYAEQTKRYLEQRILIYQLKSHIKRLEIENNQYRLMMNNQQQELPRGSSVVN